MTLQPLERTFWPLLWQWMQDAPTANFDDGGPTTVEGFAHVLEDRLAAGEWLIGVFVDERPVGAIGYRPGWLHGICFAPEARGTGIAAEALAAVLETVDEERIEAAYYATNARVGRFLAKAGFEETGRHLAAVTQQGRPVDVVCVRRQES